MKATHWMMYTLLGITLLLTACVDDDKDLSQPKEPEKTTDLIIPDDANWTTTRSVNLSIHSPVATRVAIYTDAACTDESLLAETPVSDISKSIELDVAKANRALYVQYPAGKGKEVISVPINRASTRAELSIKLPENVSGFDTNGGEGAYSYQWYPVKGGEATLMMEDNWPATGDYDFNDFVIGYRTQATFFDGHGGSKEDYEQDGLEIKITFRAMGGYLPYRLGLQLDKTHARYIDDVIEIEGNDLVKMELQNPGEDAPAIFIFTGTEQLRKRNNGGTFYNTEPDHAIANNDLVTIKYRLKINCFKNLEKTQALWAAATSENQNFFLQKEKNGGREIHLRGYEPTAYYSNSYAGEAGGNMRTDIKYCSTDNFVWGIKIPVAIPHPIEKIDIMQVYSKFRSWITEPNHSDPSSPDFNENWFKYYDTSKVIG